MAYNIGFLLLACVAAVFAQYNPYSPHPPANARPPSSPSSRPSGSTYSRAQDFRANGQVPSYGSNGGGGGGGGSRTSAHGSSLGASYGASVGFHQQASSIGASGAYGQQSTTGQESMGYGAAAAPSMHGGQVALMGANGVSIGSNGYAQRGSSRLNGYGGSQGARKNGVLATSSMRNGGGNGYGGGGAARNGGSIVTGGYGASSGAPRNGGGMIGGYGATSAGAPRNGGSLVGGYGAPSGVPRNGGSLAGGYGAPAGAPTNGGNGGGYSMLSHGIGSVGMMMVSSPGAGSGGYGGAVNGQQAAPGRSNGGYSRGGAAVAPAAPIPGGYNGGASVSHQGASIYGGMNGAQASSPYGPSVGAPAAAFPVAQPSYGGDNGGFATGGVGQGYGGQMDGDGGYFEDDFAQPSADDPDGDSIIGTAGQDYPVYGDVPMTSFSCANQRFPGLYADPEAQCQVFHICQADGHQDSFLCPSGSIFNQQYFVCDWWYNVDCGRASSFYELNAELYKDPARYAAAQSYAQALPTALMQPSYGNGGGGAAAGGVQRTTSMAAFAGAYATPQQPQVPSSYGTNGLAPSSPALPGPSAGSSAYSMSQEPESYLRGDTQPTGY